MHPFFDRDPNTVANELRGRILRYGDHTCILSELAARDETHCGRFRTAIVQLEPRIDASVEMYLGQPNLFIRTKDGAKCGTCVQVKEIEMAGQRINGPVKVCRDLGLTQHQILSVEFDGIILEMKPTQ